MHKVRGGYVTRRDVLPQDMGEPLHPILNFYTQEEEGEGEGYGLAQGRNGGGGGTTIAAV